MSKFKIGDRVAYADNGPEDVGTILEVEDSISSLYRVQFAVDGGEDWYTEGQLMGAGDGGQEAQEG